MWTEWSGRVISEVLSAQWRCVGTRDSQCQAGGPVSWDLWASDCVAARSTLLVEDAQYGEHGSVCAVAVVRAMQHGALLLQGERQQRQQAVGVRPGGQPHAAHVPGPLLSPARRQNCAPGKESTSTSDTIIYSFLYSKFTDYLFNLE